MDDRAFASATRLANEIRDRRIGCVELLDFYLARAERHNPQLNAIVVWQIEQARERARAADAALAQGERWGPLHGIPSRPYGPAAPWNGKPAEERRPNCGVRSGALILRRRPCGNARQLNSPG